MTTNVFGIEPFLSFLNKTPKEEFDPGNSEQCAYAMYLKSCGFTRVCVWTYDFRAVDANGTEIRKTLPVELGDTHTIPMPENYEVSYDTLAQRIYHRIERLKTMDAKYLEEDAEYRAVFTSAELPDDACNNDYVYEDEDELVF